MDIQVEIPLEGSTNRPEHHVNIANSRGLNRTMLFIIAEPENMS
jgi:hypothetical protein